MKMSEGTSRIRHDEVIMKKYRERKEINSMSHYAIAVIHRGNQDVDELLEPYWEGLEVEPYVWKTKDELIKYGREYYSETETMTDDECFRFMTDAMDKEIDEDGNVYSTYNPDSKWDWYEEGGRFCNMLKLKGGATCDSARIADLDFSIDENLYKESKKWWEDFISPGEKKDEYDGFYNLEYFTDRYKDAEEYATRNSSFTTYAVLTPDGEWHAPGEIGWFGCSSETSDEMRDWDLNYKKRFIDESDPDWIMTIVDCHI